jgi:Alginate lyase
VHQRLGQASMRRINFQPGRRLSRRGFCTGAAGCAALLLADHCSQAAPMPAAPPATPTRPDVTAIDHDRIIAAANRWLEQKPVTVTSLPCTRTPGTPHEYYSEAEADAEATAPAKASAHPPFTSHRDAVFAFGLAVPALTAAYRMTGEERYAEHAVAWLHAWLVDVDTRMTPAMEHGQTLTVSGASSGQAEGILETLPLVEVAVAIPFLVSSAALTDTDRKAMYGWFAAYLDWLTRPEDSGPRLAALARDRKDHHATSWLLQASAYATLAAAQSDVARAEDSMLAELRRRYKRITLRAQMHADGTFPQELVSATPYRDSLFNLDMMAGICHLLSTRFDSVWDYSLEDGPGMRSAIAYHFPFIEDRSLWPYKADAQHFKELPGRRASLLFSARAYERPEYAAAWKTLLPDPSSPEVLRTMPIHQPLLWISQPARAL